MLEGEVDGARAVVITHDCDLDNDGEDFLEILIGVPIPTLVGDFTRAKNSRKLHLPFGQTEELLLELIQRPKKCIYWEQFRFVTAPDSSFDLTHQSKKILRRWLATRYGRPAFPNAFETRLRKAQQGNKSLLKELDAIIKSKTEHVTGVFFALGADRYTELAPGQPYELRIYVLYEAESLNPLAKQFGTEVASKLQALFLKYCGPPETSKTICIDACEAQSIDSFTLFDVRKTDQWRLEYFSLGADAEDNGIDDAQTP